MWCNSWNRPGLEGANIESSYARQTKGGEMELIGVAGDISHPLLLYLKELSCRTERLRASSGVERNWMKRIVIYVY